jgi:hypothetical protein
VRFGKSGKGKKIEVFFLKNDLVSPCPFLVELNIRKTAWCVKQQIHKTWNGFSSHPGERKWVTHKAWNIKGRAIVDPALLLQFIFYAVPVFDSSIPASAVLHPEASGCQRHI